MKFWMCGVISALFLALPLVCGGGEKPTAWLLVNPQPGGTYDLSEVESDGFSLKVTRSSGAGKAAVLVCSNINRTYHGQSRLSFTCRVDSPKPVTIQVLLSLRDEGKSVLRFGRKIEVAPGKARNFVFPLDVDFHLADAMYVIQQLKISCDISGAPEDMTAKLAVSRVKIGAAAEEGGSGKAEIVVFPAKRPEVKPAPNALKIYFMLDNDDDLTVFGGRGAVKPISDVQPYRGYRDYLLHAVRPFCTIAASPEEADAVVYSGCRANPGEVARVAAKVASGTPLFAAGPVADPEIAGLLPVEIDVFPSEGIPVRRALKAAAGSEALFSGLNPAAFGVYSRLRPKDGAKTLLTFADGAPAIVRRGNVLYSGLTLGAELIPGKTSPDAFLLRAVAELTGRKIPEADKIPPAPDADGFYEGAGRDNFGRFGIVLGDGLSCESVNNYLEVANGASEYFFSSESAPKLTLNAWNFRKSGDAGQGLDVDSRYRWTGLGRFELTAHCVIPADWRGEELRFVVEKGIDDTAEVFFNGSRIGAVNTATPQYWMTPHRHAIPASLVKYGEDNVVRIVTENLRDEGAFGSCPEILIPQTAARPQKFVPDRINQIGKGGILTEANGASRRFDSSLAFPGVRWEIFSDSVNLTLINTADFAAIPGADGMKIYDLSKTDSLPVDWTKPYCLLFPAGTGRPLLLVLSRKQVGLTVNRVGGQPGGLRFARSGGVGMIVPLWLCGVSDVDCSKWRGGIPAEILRKIEFWGPKAFCYPENMTERFRIDAAAKKVFLRSAFTYLKTPNDWGVSSAPFAPVPPLAYYTKGRLFESASVENWDLLTNFGFFAARNGTVADWSLPLPEPALSLVPRMEDCTKELAAANEVFHAANRWSAGGHTPMLEWSLAYPTGKKYASLHNIGMHGFLMGLNQMLAAPFSMDSASSAEYWHRLRLRLYEPLERARYKAAYRWREEPLSGVRYPIYFGSRRTHPTKYAPGTGTTINYGDANETVHVIFDMLQQLADQHGETDLVRTLPGFIEEVVRLLLVSDDWGYLACSCRESGQSATIDMLNAELGSMIKLARIAEILGDEPLRNQALYRAARRQIPSVARLDFAGFAARHGMIAYPENVAVGVGFSEEGLHYRTKGYLPVSIDLFDMSQGYSEELAVVMRKYAPKEFDGYFTRLVQPYLDKSFGMKYSHWELAKLTMTAMYGSYPADKLAARLEEFLANRGNLSRLGEDWPGITMLPDVSQILAKLYGAAKIVEARDMNLRDFAYSAARKTLMLEYTAGRAPRLVLECKSGFAGKDWPRDPNGRIVVPVKPGESQKLELILQ